MSDVDVIVVGCGPTGAMAANLLGKAGLSVLVIEQQSDPHPLPRAVHLDHEMMRLLQSVQLVDELLPIMRDTDGHLHIGADGGVIRYMGTVGLPRPFGWSNDYFFYQPELEALLRRALQRYPAVQLRLGTECLSLAQDAAQVAVTVGSAAGNETVTARWLIACDGARSSLRKLLNIALDDLNFDEPWLVVDAEVDGPVHFPDFDNVPRQADLQRLSVMLCDPNRPATVVPGRGNHRRWEFMLKPGEDDQEMMQQAAVSALIEPWLQDVPHRIVRAATYRFHGLVAQQWQQGRVFLAGDAAHQTPPFFGQGMCHGLRDVANLAWKMQLIAAGHADELLLTTYQPERDPHVRAVINAAIAAGKYVCMLDPQEAASRDQRMREQARSATHTTATDLIPALTAGVVFDSPAAGERFVQPWLSICDRKALLDDETGGGWRLFVRTAAMAQDAQRCADRLVPTLAMSVIDVESLADEGVLTQWLLQRGATAVLVRPDFYVFGTSSGRVEQLLSSLACCLTGSTVHTDGQHAWHDPAHHGNGHHSVPTGRLTP